MDYFSHEYKKFLVRHKVFDAWQYINNTWKNIKTATYCQEVIHKLIYQMISEHKAWLEDLNQELDKHAAQVAPSKG